MVTIRQIWETTAALAHRLEQVPFPASLDGPALGGDPTLEASIARSLQCGLKDLETWPLLIEPEAAPHIRLRLLFALECLKQMEAAEPEMVMAGTVLPVLLHHALIDRWPMDGMEWMRREFGPRRAG
jgi:hypothetical protein